MNKKTKLTIVTIAFILCVCCLTSANVAPNWKLGTQAYSFNRFSFYEAVDKTKSLGL